MFIISCTCILVPMYSTVVSIEYPHVYRGHINLYDGKSLVGSTHNFASLDTQSRLILVLITTALTKLLYLSTFYID